MLQITNVLFLNFCIDVQCDLSQINQAKQITEIPIMYSKKVVRVPHFHDFH